jgi:aminoglycoside phosphotransferase family enzyme/predicted kinase
VITLLPDRAGHRYADVVSAMRDLGFYGIADEVEVRETHLSYVFLTGDRAFKLKKPLVLSFADYGTPERRRAMCEAEVRLNRRLAPSVYLGVRSVVADGGALALGGRGDPRAIEHVVEMRRFREEDTLAARLEAGPVDERQLADVGRRLALFHSAADHGDAGAALGTLADTLTSTLDDLATLVARSQRPLVAGFRRFIDAYLRAHRPLLDARGGRVVHGHGDIRAEHVLLADPIEVVDCVEFDDRLRELDCARDLAFLLMDLEAFGHRAAAVAVLRGYSAGGGDPGPDHLLAFYACERALVRAKVGLIRAAQLPRAAESAPVRVEADHRLALARRFAWRARKPALIVLCGLSGSGKTHLAGAIAGVSGLRPLNSDVVRKRLAGVAPGERAAVEHYSADFSRRTYAELGRLAGDGDVVVDATFRRAEDRAAFLEALLPHVPEPLFVRCVAPPNVLRERVAERRGGVSDVTVELLEDQRFDPLDEVGPDRQFELRTERPAEEAVDALEAWLDERMAGR